MLARRQADDGDHVEYRLTRKGHDIHPILMAIRDWGDAYLAPDGPPARYRHRDCTGEAHARLTCDTCDTCGTDVTAHDITPEPGPGVTGVRSPTGCSAASLRVIVSPLPHPADDGSLPTVGVGRRRRTRRSLESSGAVDCTFARRRPAVRRW
ncbi:winged helix-turn-helix transcriptional regulator [Kitasatospora sp. CB01950]|uniref:winged helix-turn-helix transcriptional regulator n=1 Tax=Kitasatospora sp. CB01950 TaxID=1703930 RepID=UPI003FCE656D